MHVPGVKQEQPDRRPVSTGPLKTDIVVRDENNTKITKVSHEDPHKIIGILNHLVEKTDGPLYVDTIVRDAGQNRILKVTGEDSKKVIRILNSLIKKTEMRNCNSPQSVPTIMECEGSPEVVSS